MYAEFGIVVGRPNNIRILTGIIIIIIIEIGRRSRVTAEMIVFPLSKRSPPV